MKWKGIRNQYPHQWLLLEAMDAHTESNRRIVEQFSVLNSYINSHQAMKSYSQIHHESPDRELYVLNLNKTKWKFWKDNGWELENEDTNRRRVTFCYDVIALSTGANRIKTSHS